jgi:hypothetical protein
MEKIDKMCHFGSDKFVTREDDGTYNANDFIKRMKFIFIGTLIGFGILFLVMKMPIAFLLLIELIMAAFFVVCVILLSKVAKNKAVKLQNTVELELIEIKKPLTPLFDEIAQTMASSNYLNLIPSQYRNSIALSTMLNYLNSGRADSWKECTKLFEEQLHNDRMLQSQLETQRNSEIAAENSSIAAEYAARAAKSARSAALGSWFR